jgi:hypothetical protein
MLAGTSRPETKLLSAIVLTLGLKDGEHQAFGSRSNIDDSETFKALHMSNRRAALTRFTPFSYF